MNVTPAVANLVVEVTNPTPPAPDLQARRGLLAPVEAPTAAIPASPAPIDSAKSEMFSTPALVCNDPHFTGKKPYSAWRKKFHSLSELEQGAVKMFIEGIMPEGVTFLGSLSGVGKTWVALSMCRALVSGEPFLGKFKVPVKTPVLYLVPEAGARSFRKRGEKMKVPMEGDMFLCRTLRDDVMKLDDIFLRSAIEDLKPVVFLDTAIRFQTGEESSASANATGLAPGVFGLLRFGAQAVVCLHHRTKSTAKGSDDMTLENVLRGSGDIGAMADAVWGLENQKCRRKGAAEFLEESKALTRITMKCVKSRDFEPAEEMVVQGRPTIDERGDFEIISQAGVEKPESDTKEKDRDAIMLRMIQDDPTVSGRAICRETGWSATRLTMRANAAGYVHVEKRWKKMATVDLNGLYEAGAVPATERAISQLQG